MIEPIKININYYINSKCGLSESVDGYFYFFYKNWLLKLCYILYGYLQI